MTNNPYEAPQSNVSVAASVEEREYAGFWIRVGASIIDTLLMRVITMPILLSVYGVEYFKSDSIIMGLWDFLLSWVFPAIAVITFWVYKSATPGKMVFNIAIIDEKTGGKASRNQLIGRYFGYYVSLIPLGAGLIAVGLDEKKQGWHDKLVGTTVIRRTLAF